MKFVSISEAQRKLTHIISEVEETHEGVVITKNGKPVVLMRFVAEGEFLLREEAGDSESVT
jgi:PHD/YefM family antitoxin component YafN of YafNO toxin-antitoxin module